MKRSKLIRESELQACRVIERVLDIRLTHNDDGSKAGMYDYHIDFPDGRTAAIEVVADTEPEVAELDSAIRRHSLTPGANQLRYDWSITLKTAARLRVLRRELPPMLFEIERAIAGSGLTSEVARNFENQLSALGVELACAVGEHATHEGKISVEAHNFRYGNLAPDSIADHCSDLLRSPKLRDVREKLARSACNERHVAIVFSLHSKFPIGSAIAKGIVPTRAPDLPAEITHMWAISGSLSQATAYWSPKGKWQLSSIPARFSGSAKIGPIHIVLNGEAFGKPERWSVTDPASGTLVPLVPSSGESSGPSGYRRP